MTQRRGRESTDPDAAPPPTEGETERKPDMTSGAAEDDGKPSADAENGGAIDLDTAHDRAS